MSGVFKFDLGPTANRRQPGWTRDKKTHYKSGGASEVRIEPLALLDVLNSSIEDVYLDRGIYPGARLIHPQLGEGVVVTCSLLQPYFFSFVPDVPGADEDDDGLPAKLRYYEPKHLDPGGRHNWGIAAAGDSWEFTRMTTEDDLSALRLEVDDQTALVALSRKLSTWQLGEAIKLFHGELKERMTTR